MPDRRQTRRQEQAAATYEQLLTAAREVFEERGYQAATVGAITTTAATAHGTFYLYFRNKEDAFVKVVEAVADELYREARAQWGRGDPHDAIEAATRGFLEVFVEHRGLWRALFEALFQSETIERIWLDIRTRFTTRIARNLDRLRDSEEIRPLDTEMTAHALGSMAEWFAFTHFVLGQPPADAAAFDRAVRTLTDLWYHAIHATVPATADAPSLR